MGALQSPEATIFPPGKSPPASLRELATQINADGGCVLAIYQEEQGVAAAKKRGLTHPYLKNYLVARCNPLTRMRKSMPSYRVALSELCGKLEAFDLSQVRIGQVAGAAMAAVAD